MIFILFGPPGVGKSFVGRIFEKEYGIYFYDADEDLTADMITAIHREQPFTPEMRHNFFNIVIARIKELNQHHSNIVMAQALIKESNRLQLLEQIPTAQFIQVVAHQEKIKSRLKIRNNWVSVEYANKIWRLFENPQLPHKKIDNNHDQYHIKQQLNQLLKV